jgi:hypothetical protein
MLMLTVRCTLMLSRRDNAFTSGVVSWHVVAGQVHHVDADDPLPVDDVEQREHLHPMRRYGMLAGVGRVTTGRLVPFCLFTDPELARVGLSESEARSRGIAYRLTKLPVTSVRRSWALSEPRGFYKALVAADNDRILAFTAFAPEAGEVMAIVQLAIAAGLPYVALREAILTHPTMAEGLVALFRGVPARS